MCACINNKLYMHPYVLNTVFLCVHVCVRSCLGLSTCRWVFITAALSDDLAYGRPLFIVISLHLISPHSLFGGDHWRPPCVFVCSHTCICLTLSCALDVLPGDIQVCTHMYTYADTHSVSTSPNLITKPPVHNFKTDYSGTGWPLFPWYVEITPQYFFRNSSIEPNVSLFPSLSGDFHSRRLEVDSLLEML